MTTAGPRSPATTSNNASIGTDAWSSTGNITVSDNTRASFTDSGSAGSNYLTATNFGFSIPSAATIDGIVVEWEKSANNSTTGGSGRRIEDTAVRIIKGGSIGSTDKSNATKWPLTGSEAYTSYGTGTTDLWGETWAASDINASTFGAAIAGIGNRGDGSEIGYVDHVRITVYYTYSGAFYATSLQKRTVTVAASATSGTDTLPMPVTNGIIFPMGWRTTYAGTDPSRSFTRIALSGTTLTATRNTADTAPISFLVNVLDATSDLVVSVEYGSVTITSGNTSATQTITTLSDATKSTVHYLGHTCTTTTANAANQWAEIDLTDASTVTAVRTGTTGDITVGFCVVEWQSSVIQSIQKRNPTLNSASGTDNETITSVDVNNTILLFAGVTTTGTTNLGCMEALQLTSATNVQFKRQATATGNHTVRYTVLEFAPGILRSVQRNTSTISTGSTTTQSITTVVSSECIVHNCGVQSSGTTFGQVHHTAELTSPTVVTSTRSISTGNVGGVGWEAFEIALPVYDPRWGPYQDLPRRRPKQVSQNSESVLVPPTFGGSSWISPFQPKIDKFNPRQETPIRRPKRVSHLSETALVPPNGSDWVASERPYWLWHQQRLETPIRRRKQVSQLSETVQPPPRIAGSFTQSTPGTYTYTVPDGVYQLSIELWGGGGGGGDGNNKDIDGGRGGGSGAYVRHITPVVPGQVINYVVGAGSVGIGLFGAGGAGEASTCSDYSLSAGGGSGGAGGNGSSGGIGGAGGTASGGNTDNINGNQGGSSTATLGGRGADAPKGGHGGAIDTGSGAGSGEAPGAGGAGSNGSAGVNPGGTPGTGANGQAKFSWAFWNEDITPDKWLPQQDFVIRRPKKAPKQEQIQVMPLRPIPLAITGTISGQLDGITSAGSATESFSGSVSATLGDTTLSATAELRFSSAIASTLEAVTLASNAEQQFVATAASTLEGVTLASNAEEQFTGTIASTLGDVTLAAEAEEEFTATITVTLGDTTLASTATNDSGGEEGFSAEIAVTLAGVTLSAAAEERFVAAIESTLAGVTLAASAEAEQFEEITGEIASTLAGVTLSAQAEERFVGSFNATLANITAAITATETFTGTVGSTLDPTTVEAQAEQRFIAAITSTLDSVTLNATANIPATADINVTLEDASLSATAEQRFTATTSATLGELTAQITAAILVSFANLIRVPSETRASSVNQDDRAIEVNEENRDQSVEDDDRLINVPEEDRTV